MNHFKIATWNVNSLRVRLPQVLAWLATHQPDVLALQETKLIDDDFPLAAIHAAGYQAVFSGQKTYNGVALLAREKTTDVLTDFHDYADPQRRVLCAALGDIRILNLYVPNGESVESDKYLYKLNWLRQLEAHLRLDIAKYPKMIVLGDFNIAPADIDVYDPKKWEGSVLFSLPERKAFEQLLQVGFVDCFRTMNNEDKAFSWWDYRMNSFKRNLGLRIDHVLSSQALAGSCVKCYVDTLPRKDERPSDHAPVVAEFTFSA